MPDTLATVAGIRRILIKAAVILLLLLLGVIITPTVYRIAKIYRYDSLAAEAYRKGDTQKALFYAYNAQCLNPRNDKSVGLIARIAMENGQHSALIWMARWTEINPKDPARQLALGKLAVTENQISVAEVCLRALKKNPKVSSAETADLEASILLRKGKNGEALQLLKDASALKGAPPGISLNYGILLLSQPETSRQGEGVQLLQALSLQPKLAIPALNNLILYSFDKTDRELAEKSAAQLLQVPELPISQYLLAMQVELYLHQKLPENFHEDIRKRMKDEKKNISTVIHWLLRFRQLEEADLLISENIEKGMALDVVRPLSAFRMADRGEWEKMLEVLPTAEWKDLGATRYALLIQACRVLKKPELDGLQKRFTEALAIELRRNPAAIFDLDKLALQWKWKKSRLKIWEAVQGQDVLPIETLKAELGTAQKWGDTVKLYGLASILLERFPTNQVMENNVITYALLLDISPEQQLGKMEKILLDHPADKSLKTTYALALLKNQRPEEALAQYADFSETELQVPAIAAYYSMALIAAGQKEKAAPYLEQATKAYLLPEEKALLQ